MTNTNKTDAAELRSIARRMSATSHISVTTGRDGSVGCVSLVGNDKDELAIAKSEISSLRASAERMGLVVLGSTETGFNACRPAAVAAVRSIRYAAQAPVWK